MMTIMGNRIAVVDDLLITKIDELNKIHASNPWSAQAKLDA